jgi:hypothetical protein
MRPERFQLQFAPRSIFGKREKVSAVLEALGKICMEFGRNLATTALRLRDAGDGNKLFAYSRISSV